MVAYGEVGLDLSCPPSPPSSSPPLDLSFPHPSPSLSHPPPALLDLDLRDAAVARVPTVAVGLF